MVNYPGIVTCDKDSYLYSKLDTIHFQLQEAKELKGFKRVGPIYEFKERSERRDGSKITLFKWPLLGRQREMTAYASLLTTMAQRRVAQQRLVDMQYANPTAHLKWAKLRKNTLVIGAEPRQGKTRLLNELLTISTELPVYRVSLTQRDAAEPYAGVRQLLLAALPLPPNASRADRQMVLTAALGAVGVARDFMCVMNPVFQVGFPVTINFRKLAPPQRLLAQKLAAERLVVSLFPQLAVVGIDDADFLDRDSWRLLRVIVDLDIVFLILATSTRVVRMSREAQEVLSLRSRVHRIRLGGIDKWYHAGLACQLLDVWAIPPELEKILQTHSRGNPGWIESYLISLVQGGWLRIQMMKRIAVEKAGLVTPPLYMLTRTCQSPDNEAEFLTAAGTRGDRWAMYRPTFADSDVELQRHRVASGVGAGGHAPAAELLAPEQWVAACVRVRPEKLEEPDKSFSVNVLIMQTLDALNPFEQLMLKCGSVIGISFNRKMLLAMMGATTYQRNVSLAVKRLFEIHVLECATRADANMAGGKPNPSTASVDPSALADNLCDCPVLDFAPDSSDLPHYAHCGFMRFRTPQYCDTTYSLLTESQKLQYHSAAIMYIESNARRCAACGHRYFPAGLVSAELAAAQAGEEGGEEPLDSLLSEEPEVELDLEFEGEDDRPCDSDDEAPQAASSSRPSFRRFSASASSSAREPSTVESSFSSVFNPASSPTVYTPPPSDLSFFSWDNFDEDAEEDEDDEEYDEDWSIDDIVNNPKVFEAQRDFQKSMITEQLLINRMQGSYLEETRGSCKRRKARAETLLARIKKNLRFWDTKGFTNFQNTVRRLLERAKTRRLGRRRPSYFLERRRSRILSSRHDKLQKTTETYSEDFSPFSSLDFRECSCSEILSSTYDSLLRHSMGASMSEKTMDILLHYAELCMELQNQPLALRLLRDAVNLMREQSRLHAAQVAKELAASDEEAPERRQKPEEDPQRQNRIPKYKMPHVFGRIHLLLGELQLAVGKESRAVPELLRALDAFGCPWPRSRAAARMHLPHALLQHSRLLQRLRPPYEAPLLRGFYAVCCVHETRCYCLLYDYFISQGKTELATLAATHAVNRALKVTRGWTSLCGPLSRMLRSWQSAGRWKAARALERTVMRTIRDLSVPSEMGQLRSAGRLLAVVACLRVQRGELAASHGVGTTALAISSATTDNFSRCEMLVLLVDTLTLRGAVEEAAEFLHRLEFFSTEQDAAREDTLWFYALCTFTLVLAGLFMTPLANLVSFVNMERTRIMREADHGPARRLAVSLWVWCLRREDWAGALVWSRLPAHSANEHDIRDAITEALRLEGLLLLVVRHLNERNLAAASHVALQVRTVIAALRQSARRLPALRPTLLLLRAYRCRIGGHDARAHALVRRGRVLAARQGNRLCAARCLLSEQAWAGEATDEEMGAWKEHSDGRDPIHWADVVYNGVPLPLPCLPPPTHYVSFRL